MVSFETEEELQGVNKDSVEIEEEELDYATLAKIGGRKDLLIHNEFVRSSDHEQPTPYPWVDWFDHDLSSPCDTAQGTHLPHKPSNLLSWEDQEVLKKKPSSKSLPSIRQRKPTHPFNNRQTKQSKGKSVKFPSIPSEPVTMVRLLSMDYQKEWVKRNNDRIAERKRKLKEKKELQHHKLLEHSMKARQVAGVDRDAEEKPRFILKRFSNIPPKVKLPQPPTT